MSVFLTAEWRNLLMVNYVVDPAVLEPYVPAGTELDFWNGRTYVSVVGFQFLRTKVLGLPIPFHRNFDELNLRFYVRRKAADGWRQGVVFVREVVPRWAVAWVARTVYNENYVSLPMRSKVSLPGPLSYEWRMGSAWNAVSANVIGEPYTPASDSEETFISEHYWGYARQRDGSTVEYEVTHAPWPVRRCEAPVLTPSAVEFYGSPFAPFLSRPPSSVFAADGSAVAVYRGKRI
jgi:uncharacterized protein